MAPSVSLDTHNVIVTAMRNDVVGVSSITVGDYVSANVEDHDPLGLAFYTFALLETGYVSSDLNSLPVIWSNWINEKLTVGDISSYTDRDLSAIGLIIYSFCRHRACPDSSKNFIKLVENHFSPTQGIFNNFFSSVLVDLGLGQLPEASVIHSQFIQYIKGQIETNKISIFNDAKNFTVVYIWAKQTEQNDILQMLRFESLRRAEDVDCLPRDLVYLTYVLFEEAENFSKQEKIEVKKYVENSLRFIRNHSLESGFNPEVVEEFANDIALATALRMQEYGYAMRPRLSRILLSIGHIIEQKYNQQPYLLENSDEHKRRWFRGIIYSLVSVALALLVIYLGYVSGLPLNAKINFETKELLQIALGCLKIVLNTLWFSTFFGLLCLCGLMIHSFFVERKEIDEVRILSKSWIQLKPFLISEVILAILIAVFSEFFK